MLLLDRTSAQWHHWKIVRKWDLITQYWMKFKPPTIWLKIKGFPVHLLFAKYVNFPSWWNGYKMVMVTNKCIKSVDFPKNKNRINECYTIYTVITIFFCFCKQPAISVRLRQSSIQWFTTSQYSVLFDFQRFFSCFFVRVSFGTNVIKIFPLNKGNATPTEREREKEKNLLKTWYDYIRD